MVSSILQNNQTTRDNIGRQDTTRTPLFKKFSEKINLEEGPTIIVKSQQVNGTGVDVFILGNADYGVLGTNKLGNTEYPNGLSTNLSDRLAVINPQNKFHEHFKFDINIDMENTTATVDLVNNKIK